MICLVTDRRRLAGGRDAIDRLVDLVTAAARAGVHLVQIRERDLDARDLTALVRRCVLGIGAAGTRIVVNDRADVALAANADGVHLRGDSIAACRIRALLAPGALVGRSVHGVEEAATVSRAGGLDYLIFGTVFATPSKDHAQPLSTLDDLAGACRAAAAAGGLPVLAIGGMTLARSALVRRAGASGVAAIGLFIPPAGQDLDTHMHTVVGALRRTFDTVEAVS